MKIGILGCFYDCAKDLDAVLESWNEHKERNSSHEFLIACVNSQFKEYCDLGYQNENIETIKKIKAHPAIDEYFVLPVPLMENEVRDVSLQYLLQQKVDVIWLLDGDEIYSYEDIDNIISYIEDNDHHGYYEINFKNYVFDGKAWVDGFCPSRIFWTRKNGGLKSCYWDNDFVYGDGVPHRKLNRGEIPREVAHIKHMTWLHEGGEKKVEYHLKHFGSCSYEWDETEKKLKINEEYFKKRNEPLPKINYEN